MVERNMVDMRFDSSFLLAENVPDDTLGYASALVCTLVQQQHHLQHQQQEAEEAGSSSKLFLQNLAGSHGPRWHGPMSRVDARRLHFL